MLKESGNEVVVYTKVLDKDKNPAGIEFKNIEDHFTDIRDLDCLVVVNGKVNFFGGAEDRPGMLAYWIINNFKGRVFYIYCDPELQLSQIWNIAAKKEFAKNWKLGDIEISRKDVIYISQPFMTDLIYESFGKQNVVPEKIIHFPFEKFPCMGQSWGMYEDPLNDSEYPYEYDLSYGGTFRNGRREKKMIKYYFGHPETISVEMFGKIGLDDFKFPKGIGKDLRAPTFTGSVNYDQFMCKMNKSMSHCVIGDPFYEKIQDIPQRVYESIWASVVTFIDADMDSGNRVYGNDPYLVDYLKVKSREELSSKILELKFDSALRTHIVKAQMKAVRFDRTKYVAEFSDLIKGLI
jgi:hypothetical protein